MKTASGLEIKLPVGDLIQEAVTLVWDKRNEMGKMFLPIIVLMAGLDLLGEYFSEASSALPLVFSVMTIMLSILFATSCHQYTLQSSQAVTSAFKRWGANEWRYIFFAIKVGFLSGIVFFALFMSGMSLVNGEEMAILMAVFAALPTLYVWGRLSILLPEVALGKTGSLGRAWALSKGNGIRITLVVIIFPFLFSLPFIYLVSFNSLVLMMLAGVGIYIVSLISLVALSLSYRFLTDIIEGAEQQTVSDSFEA